MLGKKVAATAMSAVLAVSLCPGLAFASPLGAGRASAENELATQAKSAVYVLDSVTWTYTAYDSTYVPAEGGAYEYDAEDDEYDWVGEGEGDYNRVETTRPATATTKLTYNKNGLVAKTPNGYALKYSGVNLKSAKYYNGASYKFTTKGGKVQSCTFKPSSDYKDVYTYTYDGSGNLTQAKSIYYSKWVNGKKGKKLKKQSTNTVRYTISKGHPVKAQRSYNNASGASGKEAPIKYAYDKKGNISKVKNAYSTMKYANKYKNGRLFTRTVNGTTYTYKFKKKSVSAAAAPVVSAQQWSLINGSMNGAFGPLYVGVNSSVIG